MSPHIPTGDMPTLTALASDTASETKSSLARSVRVLTMGDTQDQKSNNMKLQGRSILTLCRHMRASITPERTKEMENRFADASLYLDWLDTNVEMTPSINNSTKTELVLKTLIHPGNHIPEDLIAKATNLLEKYESDEWGKDIVPDEDLVEVTTSQVSASILGSSIGVVQLPDANDPVFGQHGIMYGVITVIGAKKRDYRLRTDIPRKSAKTYGHNGITLGTWYPFQINALFWGAHGARMAGIAGSVTTGAWSIVVANTYHDLDTDHGNIIYYSGSNSHNNTDPQRAASPSQGTKALHASIRTQNPVRVLRSGGAPKDYTQNDHLPSCGLRYDGLYRVTTYRQRRNQNGGLYDQFKLERLPEQTPLTELEKTSPTKEQKAARERLS